MVGFGIDNRDPQWWLPGGKPKPSQTQGGGFDLFKFFEDFNARQGERNADRFKPRSERYRRREQAERQEFAQNSGDLDRRRSTRLRGRVQQAERGAPVDEGSGKTLMDYIAEIESMMGGGPDFGALRDRLSSKTAESDARLQAMYRSLGQARDAAAPELARTYDTAKSEIEKAAEQTAASISQGYQDAQNQRAEELAALGIEDAATRPEGERIAEDQGFARQIAAQGSQGSLNANAGNKASSLAYNTDMRGVGDMQGVEARASLQSRLRDELAEIAFQESAQRAQSRQSAIGQAMQMMQADQAAQGDGLSAWQRAQLERDYAQFQADQQSSGQRVSIEQQEARRRSWQGLLEQFDGDVQKANEVYQQMQAAGLI